MSRRNDRLNDQADTERDWLAQQHERPNIEMRREPATVPTVAVPTSAAHYHCVQCHQLKPGRFTQHREFRPISYRNGRGWSRSVWYCFDCLGESR